MLSLPVIRALIVSLCLGSVLLAEAQREDRWKGLGQIEHGIEYDDNAVFSARSSWSDVQFLILGSVEALEVTTKREGTRMWTHPVITENRISDGKESFLRTDIARIVYVRLKPLSQFEQTALHEDVGWLAPRLWLHGLFKGKLKVQLYDAALPEDNSRLSCK